MSEELNTPELCGLKARAKPERKKKTMSVPEMRRLLGLGKTDSYWLVHKNFFKIRMVNGKMRVDIASFEKWYANQVKYKKIDGDPPGEELRRTSYSVPEIADMLGLSSGYTYVMLKEAGVNFIIVDYWKRIPKEEFERWYASQTRHRIREDRERDRDLEENSIWLPDAAKMLGLNRGQMYSIVRSNSDVLEIVVIGDRKRVTKKSFVKWYESQDKYRLLSEEEMEARRLEREQELRDARQERLPIQAKSLMLREPNNPRYYTVKEIRDFYGVSDKTLTEWIKKGYIDAVLVGKAWRIARECFDDWLDMNNT